MRHGRRGLCVVAAGALFVLVCALTGCAGTRLDGRSGDATDGSVRDVAGDTHSSDRGEPDDAGSTQDLASDLGAGDDPGAVDVVGDAARDGLTDGAGAACGGCLGAAYESCTDACVRAGYPGGLCTDPGGTSPARCCTCEAADFAVSGIEPGGYTVGTLAVGAPVYSDRDYTFADVGPFAGATYLLTANDDKYATGNEFLRFDVNLTARVRVGFDTRAAPPAWLGSWTLTGAGITTTDTLFDVYERLVDPGRVTLGGAGIGGGASMYTVVITAAPECLAGVCDDGSVPPPLDAGSDAAPDAGPDVAPDTPRDDGCGTYGDEPFMSWRFVGPVASGAQIDAVRGPGGRVHLISDRYFEFDCDGAVVVDEGVGDGHQGGLDFPPALAVGDDGTVHIVTRHDGDWNGGEDIRYRRRNASGGWDRDYIFGGRVKRNYVVGAAWAGPDAVYLSSSRGGSDVWGDLRIWSAGVMPTAVCGAPTGACSWSRERRTAVAMPLSSCTGIPGRRWPASWRAPCSGTRWAAGAPAFQTCTPTPRAASTSPSGPIRRSTTIGTAPTARARSMPIGGSSRG